MASPRDPIDDWLEREVTPLSPAPGTLDRIRRQARGRKTRQASIAAAGCAVVIAAAVVTPQVLPASQRGPSTPRRSVAGAPTSVPATVPSGVNTPAPEGTGQIQARQRSRLSVTSSGTVPPPGFRPTSVTFVGNGSDGVVGAVIGQAGTRGHCSTADCTSLAGTSDYGASWYGVSAPVAPGPDGGSGVSQLRFASVSDGWAYGPALYETSGGGWPWHRESTGGRRVLALEAAPAQRTAAGAAEPARAFAVFGSCAGTGADYAADCTSFSLETSVAGSATWAPVSVPAGYQPMTASNAGAPLLVIGSHGATGYLLATSGAVLSGPAAGGSWQVASQAPCAPAAAAGAGAGSSASPGTGASGQGTETGAQLAAGPDGLLLTCDSAAAGGGTAVVLYTSATGALWQRAGTVTVSGSPVSLAAAVSGQAVLATTTGIEYSGDGGATWRAARFSTALPAGGFSYVGMTDATQGVAVPAAAATGAVWVTGNGGRTWHRSPISSS